jgi:GNAT superfamily N-acetyltransferase
MPEPGTASGQPAPPAGFRLRRAGGADAGEVSRLVDAAYRHYVPLLGRTPMPMLTDFAAAIRDREVWLLEDDRGIAAVLELLDRGDELWIEDVAVEPSRQGLGLGRWLLGFAEREAGRLGRTRIGLLTNERYAKNIAMYERYGYRETHREPYLGSDLVHFAKSLDG